MKKRITLKEIDEHIKEKTESLLSLKASELFHGDCEEKEVI